MKFRERLEAAGAMVAHIVLVYVFAPPVGGVMMLISCQWRDLSNADIALGILIPIYGHVTFWTCP